MESPLVNMGLCDDCLRYDADPCLCCPMAQLAREGKREWPEKCGEFTPIDG